MARTVQLPTFDEIVAVCNRLYLKRLGFKTIRSTEIKRLARLFRIFIDSLPEDEKDDKIAFIGKNGAVKVSWKEIPDRILNDREFALLVIEVFANEF